MGLSHYTLSINILKLKLQEFYQYISKVLVYKTV